MEDATLDPKNKLLYIVDLALVTFNILMQLLPVLLVLQPMHLICANLCYFAALYDYQAADDYEISFYSGDIITEIEEVKESGIGTQGLLVLSLIVVYFCHSCGNVII